MVGAGGIVVAAGSSRRLGSVVPKPYLRIGGRTLLGHVLAAFEDSASVCEVVVVASDAYLARARRIARSYGKVCAVVIGGNRRQDSVRNGLRALSTSCSMIAVHDAARPLVTSRIIDGTVEAAVRFGAAIAASPVVDTLKAVEGDRIVATVDRSRFWRAETPQVVRRAWLEAAFVHCERNDVAATDEASMLEATGRPVRVVPSSTANPKVTTEGDLGLVRALLRRR